MRSIIPGVRLFKTVIDFVEKDIKIGFAFEAPVNSYFIQIFDLSGCCGVLELRFKKEVCLVHALKGLVEERTIQTVELMGIIGSTVIYQRKK